MIIECVSSDVGLLVVCAGLGWSGSTPLSQLPLQFARRARSHQAPLSDVHVRPTQGRRLQARLISLAVRCLRSRWSLDAIIRRTGDEELQSLHTSNDWLTGAARFDAVCPGRAAADAPRVRAASIDLFAGQFTAASIEAEWFVALESLAFCCTYSKTNCLTTAMYAEPLSLHRVTQLVWNKLREGVIKCD